MYCIAGNVLYTCIALQGQVSHNSLQPQAETRGSLSQVIKVSIGAANSFVSLIRKLNYIFLMIEFYGAWVLIGLLH